MKRIVFINSWIMRTIVGSWIIAMGQTRVMLIGKPDGQHWPMSSLYVFPSLCAFRAASYSTWARGVSLNPAGGANLKLLSGPPPCNQVPVRSNGGFGRGLAILDGASAPSDPGAWNCAARFDEFAMTTTAAIAAVPIRLKMPIVFPLLFAYSHSDDALLVH